MVKEWTEEKVIQEIKRLDSLDIGLSAGYTMRMNRPLYDAGLYFFSDWTKALYAAGMNYELELTPFNQR